MRDALVADLAAIRRHRIVTTVDPRFPLKAPPGVEVVTLPPGGDALLDGLMASADAVWLVAPETDGCLERLAARVEKKGTTLLGPGAAAIRRASDKAGLPRRLARHGVAHPADARPPTRDADWGSPRARSAIRSSSSPRGEPAAKGCASPATRVSCAAPWTWLAGPMERDRCCSSATCGAWPRACRSWPTAGAPWR